MKIHEKVKALRKKKGLTQQELADILGLHLAHTNRPENGHLQPSLEVLKKLIHVLEVSADYLLDDSSDEVEVKIEDKSLAQKIQLIEQLDPEDRNVVNCVIDAMLTNHKMRQLVVSAQ